MLKIAAHLMINYPAPGLNSNRDIQLICTQEEEVTEEINSKASSFVPDDSIKAAPSHFVRFLGILWIPFNRPFTDRNCSKEFIIFMYPDF
jgi:hypothetical protein